MQVSRICLGCMTFGLDSSEKYEWTLSEAESIEILEHAIDLGITFFDTSNSYSWGDSERVLGSVLSEYDRDEMVVATKVYNDPAKDAHPNASGLSRKTIEQEVEASLERLGMDTIDLYQIHRWDYDTPIEETVRALDDLVRRNKVRYVGASSMWAHQFQRALTTADRAGLERFATMQNHYSLVYREEEREMLPLCANEGVGVMAWSPLAKGFLARPHRETRATSRGETDSLLHERPYDAGGNIEINERVEELADRHGVSMAQIAIAWLLHTDCVTVPIVGTTSTDHLDDAVEALEIDLSSDDLAYLEEPYEPIPITGHE
ncbi:aldo/keto reductase [Natronobiforma cellulositropha]